MKLFNHIFEFHFHARRPLSHFKVHRRPYYSHLVWWRVSLIWGQPHLEPIEVHAGCGGEVHGLAPDGVSYCTECEHICEGETEFITMEEFEAR